MHVSICSAKFARKFSDSTKLPGRQLPKLGKLAGSFLPMETLFLLNYRSLGSLHGKARFDKVLHDYMQNKSPVKDR